MFYTANMCMGNTHHEKLYFWNILDWFKCTNYSLYDIKKYFQKYNWKYHLSAVLGTVIKCPKGTGSAWETLHHEKLYFWQSIYLQCRCLLIRVIRLREISPEHQVSWPTILGNSYLHSSVHTLLNFDENMACRIYKQSSCCR